MDVISTAHLPALERFDFWREVSTRLWVPYDLRCESETESRFRARVQVSDFDQVQVTNLATTPHLVQRTDKLIRQTDPEVVKLGCMIDGGVVVEQAGQRAELRAGDLVLFDTSSPFQGRHDPDRRASRLLLLQFPRALLPLPAQEVRRLSCVRIPGDRGLGALSSQFLLQLARSMDEFSPAEGLRLSTLTLDVLTTVLAGALDAEGTVPPGTRRRALVARVHAFIRNNLDDPGLTPDAIAAAHHISVRYLHKVFRTEGHTVASWIRECRLARCRRDLADVRLATQPISAIAGRWGFTSPAHFSQVFRGTYGLSPSKFRREHAQECTPTKEQCTHRQ
jgi:AraC-like DNA-binding protein